MCTPQSPVFESCSLNIVFNTQTCLEKVGNLGISYYLGMLFPGNFTIWMEICAVERKKCIRNGGNSVKTKGKILSVLIKILITFLGNHAFFHPLLKVFLARTQSPP